MNPYSLKNVIRVKVSDNALIFTIIISSCFICLMSMIYSFSVLNIRNGFISLIFFLSFLLIYPLEYVLKAKFKPIIIICMTFVILGSLLGACYNFYHILPFLDTILHGVSGFIFTYLGFELIKNHLIPLTDKKSFLTCLFFSLCFSLSIALIWEIFEYTITITFGYDMVADTYVNKFTSYLLTNDHNKLFVLNNIKKTTIYYDNNKVLSINGYLDIGLIDTLTDMIIHTIATITFVFVSLIKYFKQSLKKL